MKTEIKDKLKELVKKYKYNAVLTLVIFILFLMPQYSNINDEYKLYLNDENIKLVNRIYAQNNEQYIHIEDLTSVFGDNAYYDKISGNLIITTHNNLKKINRSDSNYVVRNESNEYFNIKKIMIELEYDVVVMAKNIFIYDCEYIEAKVKVNRAEIYDIITNKVVAFVDANMQINVKIDPSLKDENTRILNVVTKVGNNEYYGYMLKENLEYNYEGQEKTNIIKKVVLVKAEDTLLSNTDVQYIDMVAINMYRLSGVSNITKLEYYNNAPGNVSVFATFNNGQKSSNYDSDITTGMLNSYENRECVIQRLVKETNKFAGINIDFGSMKTSDKDNFTQFIKELAAVLHAAKKQIIITVSSTQYIDIVKVSKFVDYIVIKPYDARTTASKTSGPISSIIYVEDKIKQLLDKSIDVSKVILEIPAYSILWTERQGTVINAEIYTMKTIQSYLTANNLESKLDKNSGQNYINYMKGITSYKMWLEDKYSVIEKTKLVNKYGLAGIGIYKSGMELKEIYQDISKTLNN